MFFMRSDEKKFTRSFEPFFNWLNAWEVINQLIAILCAQDNVEELLNKCGSAKWSERKEGLLGLQGYLKRHGSLPPQYFNRIGTSSS